MNIEDTENLEILNRKLILVRDRVRAVAFKHSHGFFLYGSGGSGKSFTVTSELNNLGTRWQLHNSSMTAAGLFETLQAHPEHVHVLEDMEQLYADKKAVGFLRAATWGDSEGNNRFVTNTKHNSRESFEFKGGIIILSNEPLSSMPALKALATRMNPAEFNPTDGEKKALMMSIAEQGKFGLSSDACIEVAEFLTHYAKKSGKPLSMRDLDNALKKRLQYDNHESQTHWRDMVTSQIDETIIEPKIKPRSRQARLVDERDIARQVYNSFPDDREARRKEWERMTGGKSERALYRRAGELGLDAPPKYLSLDDFTENQATEQPS
jgi:hypothetical protein